jgi:diguanylate cyclase (GGDEF)-like protein
VDVLTAAAAVLLVAALIGALVGSAGYTLLIERRQNHRIARMAERLVRAADEGALVALEAERINDARLRSAFRVLADRVADTWRLATIDPLTGIANRQTVLARLDEELSRANRYRRQLSVIMIDLDHFKRLNDAHGHAAGDAVLRHVGQELAASVRSVDFAGRYGGEEFLVVLPETGPDAAASLAEKLRRAVGASLVRLPEGELVTVALSAGVAGGQGDVLRLDDLVRDADAALYSAKSLGRDQVYVFRETGDDGTIRRAPISSEARTRAVDVGRSASSAAQDALLSALSGRQPWSGRPSTLIAEASVALARAIDLPTGELDRIRTASLLHDLGKLAIPDEILARPGDLAISEWRVVTEHPKIGQVVLEQAGALRDAANIVLHHHEWYDGRGYPHGLAGPDIPIGARIVSIVDAYEAMVAGRPYRAAITHEQALAELRRQAGVQFDPDLVELFAALFSGGMPWEPDGHDHGHDHAPDHVDETHGVAVVAAAGLGELGATKRRRDPSPSQPGPGGPARTTAELHDAVHEQRRRAG